MSLDPHVSATLVVNNSGVALAGFGLIMVPTYKTVFPERRRYYSKAASAITDGFPSDSPEVIALTRIFQQNPHPPQVMVGRFDAAHAPTQRYSLKAVAARSGFSYQLQVDGEGVTSTQVEYAADADTTIAEVNGGLLTSVNLVSGKNFTATFEASTATAGTFTATNATETLNRAAHGYQTGDGPFQLTTTTTLPAGLSLATNYWVIRTGADTFKLATSLANAFASANVLLGDDGTGVHTITPTAALSPALGVIVTGDAPGAWFSIESLDRTAVQLKQTHDNPGISADLTVIQNADSSWYYLHTTFNSDATVLDAANWVEANGKMYYPDVLNTECENTATGNSEIGDDLLALGLKRTMPCYHSGPKYMLGAGIMGRIAPLNPGKWTAAYKSIAGVPFMTFTDTQFVNLDARKMTYYKREAGRSITWEGKVGNADFGYADITTALDWFLDRLKKACFGVFASQDKVSFTDEDISMVKGAAEGVVLLGQSDAYKIIAPGTKGDPNDPVPVVFFPKVRDIDPGARALRKIPNATVTFRIQGAAQSVDFEVDVSF